jgi:hypothetical protein
MFTQLIQNKQVFRGRGWWNFQLLGNEFLWWVLSGHYACCNRLPLLVTLTTLRNICTVMQEGLNPSLHFVSFMIQYTFFHIFLNLLAPEFGISILAHPVCKMRIMQEPKKVASWNKRHFEEKKNGECAACLKKFVRKFVEKYIKCGVWRVAVCLSYI